jgi:peptide/nickel transport system substrate-binding protein
MQRRPVRRRITVVAAAALVAIAAFGVQVALSGSNATSAKDVLVSGTTDSVTNIDPAGNYDFGSFTVDANIFEHLYDARNGTKLVPSLATACRPAGTTKKWRCTLRRGVKFHDGSSFDSADVKWSFDRVIKIKDDSGIYTLLDPLKSVTTNGAYAVTFNLKQKVSTWPNIISSGAGFIVPQGLYPNNKLRSNSESQIGTGPYKLTKYTPGQQAVYERFDDYWGKPAKTENLIMRYFTKSSTMKLALQRGEIDMAFQTFTPVELVSLGEQRGIRVYQGQGAVIRYLVMNVVRAPFNKLAVRRAMAYLMPRQAIAARVYRGQVKPLFSMPAAGLPGHTDAFATMYGRTPNVAKAKAVMTAAGVQMPLAVEIWWTPTHYGDASADEYAEIKRALDASGVFKVTLKSTEWAQYSDVPGERYDAFQLGWFPDYPDAENYLSPFYKEGNFTANGYSSKKMTALLSAMLGAPTEAKRLAIIRQIQLLAAREVPIIPYWQSDMIAVGRSNVRGIPTTLDAAFIMRFWKISKTS